MKIDYAGYFGTIIISNYSMHLSYLAESITKKSRLVPHHQRTQHRSVPFHNFKITPHIIFGSLYKYHTTRDNYAIVQWLLSPCR